MELPARGFLKLQNHEIVHVQETIWSPTSHSTRRKRAELDESKRITPRVNKQPIE
jgi:hypothetical protein